MRKSPLRYASVSKVSKRNRLLFAGLVAAVLVFSIWALYKVTRKSASDVAIKHLESFVEKKVSIAEDGKCSGTDKQYTFYFFAMETCPHCISFDPEWRKFVGQVENNRKISDNVCMAKVLAEDKNDGLLNKYGVKAFPTLLLIDNRNGKVVECNSDRTVEGLTEFVLQNVSS